LKAMKKHTPKSYERLVNEYYKELVNWKLLKILLKGLLIIQYLNSRQFAGPYFIRSAHGQ
jgi:hypothetical protein